MSTLHEQMTVNEVIRLFPATVEVFSRLGIDACCGGTKPLHEAAGRHGMDADELLDALRAVIRAA